jgi:SPP1 gp7 family putative phage head morphogenesis protein
MKVQTVKQAYRKMRKRGIVTPPLTVTDMTTKAVKEIYHLNLDRLEKEILKNLDDYNIEHKKSVLVRDSIESLIDYISRMGEDSTFVKKLVGNLEIMMNADTDIYHYEKLKKRMRNQFGSASTHFFKDLFEDSDENLVNNLFKYKLDKNDVFEQRIESIKESYVDNAIERIAGEQNELKKMFLKRLTDWITGTEKNLDVKDIISEMKKTAVREARFFARDQFCKFNKSLLIASFKNAGVTRVRLTTCKDGAVRQSHRAWEEKGKIFDIDNIPLAWWNDYNCRCGAVPIWI